MSSAMLFFSLSSNILTCDSRQADVAMARKEVYGNKGYMVDGEMLQGS
jgi:hypothetical protein